MTRIVKEGALIVLGVAIGFGLFLFSGVFSYDPSGCGGCTAHGWPWFWYIRATGPSFPTSPMEPQYLMDLAFWLIAGYVATRAIASCLPVTPEVNNPN